MSVAHQLVRHTLAALASRAQWDESKHRRGKTSEKSRGGSFAPKGEVEKARTAIRKHGWNADPSDPDYFERTKAADASHVAKLAKALGGTVEEFGPSTWLIKAEGLQATVSKYTLQLAKPRDVKERPADQPDEEA